MTSQDALTWWDMVPALLWGSLAILLPLVAKLTMDLIDDIQFNRRYRRRSRRHTARARRARR